MGKLRRWIVWWSAPLPKQGDEQGDVPGWVLITIMTAGLVGGLWKFAGPELESMLSNALSSVSE